MDARFFIFVIHEQAIRQDLIGGEPSLGGRVGPAGSD